MDKPKSCDCGKNVIIQKFQYMDHDKKKIIIDDENYILYCPTCDIYMNPMPLKELIKKWNSRQSKSIELDELKKIIDAGDKIILDVLDRYVVVADEHLTDLILEYDNLKNKLNE